MHPAAAAGRRRAALRAATPVAAAVLAVAPCAAAAGWALDQVRAPAEQDLARTTATAVPAVVADAAGSPDQVRSLVLRASGAGERADGGAGAVDTALPALEVAVVRGTGPALDRAAAAAQVRQAYRPAADDPAGAALDVAVGDLVTGRGDARAALAPFGVGAVVLLLPGAQEQDQGRDQDRAAAGSAAADAVAARLDAVEGLTPAGETPSTRAWRVQPVSAATADAADRPAAVRVLPAPGAPADAAAVPPAWQALPSGERSISTRLPDGPAGRVLALAERSHPTWTATLDGRPLEQVPVDGWAQGFVLPRGDGHLVVRQGPASGPVLLTCQLLVLLATVLLAVPVRPGRSPGPAADRTGR